MSDWHSINWRNYGALLLLALGWAMLAKTAAKKILPLLEHREGFGVYDPLLMNLPAIDV